MLFFPSRPITKLDSLDQTLAILRFVIPALELGHGPPNLARTNFISLAPTTAYSFTNQNTNSASFYACYFFSRVAYNSFAGPG